MPGGTLTKDTLATPSELQNDYKRLLDLAADGTVSIKQRGGKPAITLVNRDAWLDAVNARAWLSILSGVVNYAIGRVMKAGSPVCPSEFSWLSLYSTDDVRAFVDEFSTAILSVMNGTRTWDDVDAIVEEWCRSAALLENKEIMERFNEASEEIEN